MADTQVLFDWRGFDDDLPVELEAVVGAWDFQHPWFMEKGHSRAQCVCVIDRMGTGFLIAENILMTNHHVFRTKEWARGQTVRFGHEYASAHALGPEIGQSYSLDPDVFFWNNDELDYAVVNIQEEPGRKFGFINISSPGQLRQGARVNIIQHPRAEYKRIAIRANQIKFFDDTVLQYLTDTEKGSSGSPVFDDNWDIVGLHHKSFEKPDSSLSYNQAHRIEAIWEDMRPHLP